MCMQYPCEPRPGWRQTEAGPASGAHLLQFLGFLQHYKFLGISAAAELAVMKRAGDNHLYTSYVLLRIRSAEMVKL